MQGQEYKRLGMDQNPERSQMVTGTEYLSPRTEIIL